MWTRRKPSFCREKKKEWKETYLCYFYELTFYFFLCEICIASWESDASGIICPRVHFSDNDTAGMLITTHCVGDLNVSWAQLWFCVHLLLVTAGNLQRWRSWLTIDPLMCTPPCSDQRGLTALSLFSCAVRGEWYWAANTEVLFEGHWFRQLRCNSSARLSQ